MLKSSSSLRTTLYNKFFMLSTSPFVGSLWKHFFAVLALTATWAAPRTAIPYQLSRILQTKATFLEGFDKEPSGPVELLQYMQLAANKPSQITGAQKH